MAANPSAASEFPAGNAGKALQEAEGQIVQSPMSARYTQPRETDKSALTLQDHKMEFMCIIPDQSIISKSQENISWRNPAECQEILLFPTESVRFLQHQGNTGITTMPRS